MIKKLAQNTRFQMIAGTILLLWICYVLAFKRTLAAWQMNRELKAQVASAQDLSRQPGYLIRTDSNLKKQLHVYHADTLAFRNNKINAIAAAAEAEHVRLSEVPADEPIYHGDKFILQRLDFQGDFFALTRLLDKLERMPDIGVIRALEYRGVKDPVHPDKKRLILQVYFEFVK